MLDINRNAQRQRKSPKTNESHFKVPPREIVEEIMKDSGKYSKKIGVFIPLGAASIFPNANCELPTEKELAGRKAILVYENNLSKPSYLIVKDSVQMLPEVVIEVEGRKFLLTIEQTPLDKTNRDIVCEKVMIGKDHVTVYPIMIVMYIGYIIQKGVYYTVQSQDVLNETKEIRLHGTDKKSTVKEVIGDNIKTYHVEKALIDLVPDKYKGMVPQRLKDKKFEFMVVEGSKNGEKKTVLFTKGNHLNTIVDYVPQMLALKPTRLIVEINGSEWYGAEISKAGVNGVFEVLNIKQD